MMSTYTPLDEVKRVRRVSDMLCTAHSRLRDRYAGRALALDLLLLAISTWLVALAFIDPELTARLTPGGIDARIWIGILGILTFLLTLVQIKTDWRGKSDSHKRTGDLYAEVKREAGYVLVSEDLSDDACRRVFVRYDLACAVGIPVPESQFLAAKKAHKAKVSISRYLDTHPNASIFLTRVRFWFRDTFGGGDEQDGESRASS